MKEKLESRFIPAAIVAGIAFSGACSNEAEKINYVRNSVDELIDEYDCAEQSRSYGYRPNTDNIAEDILVDVEPGRLEVNSTKVHKHLADQIAPEIYLEFCRAEYSTLFSTGQALNEAGDYFIHFHHGLSIGIYDETNDYIFTWNEFELAFQNQFYKLTGGKIPNDKYLTDISTYEKYSKTLNKVLTDAGITFKTLVKIRNNNQILDLIEAAEGGNNASDIWNFMLRFQAQEE